MRLFKTGSLVLSNKKRDNHFSEENWNVEASRYRIAISGLSDESWELIIDGAWEIAQESRKNRSHNAPSSSKFIAEVPEQDERELLVEGGENIEDDGIMDWDACE